MNAHCFSKNCLETPPWKVESVVLPMHLMMVHRGEPTLSTKLTGEHKAIVAHMDLLCYVSSTEHSLDLRLCTSQVGVMLWLSCYD